MKPTPSQRIVNRHSTFDANSELKLTIKNSKAVVNVWFDFYLTLAKVNAIRCYLRTGDYVHIYNATGDVFGEKSRVLTFTYNSSVLTPRKFERLMRKMSKSIQDNVRY